MQGGFIRTCMCVIEPQLSSLAALQLRTNTQFLESCSEFGHFNYESTNFSLHNCKRGSAYEAGESGKVQFNSVLVLVVQLELFTLAH